MASKNRVAKESFKHLLQNFVIGPNHHFPEDLDWMADEWVDELIEAVKESIMEDLKTWAKSTS